MLKTIDLRSCADLAAAHRLLAAELNFPEWYGHNLDALYDLLSGEPELQLQLLCPQHGPLCESGELTTLLLVITDALGERAVVPEEAAAEDAPAEMPAAAAPACDEQLN